MSSEVEYIEENGMWRVRIWNVNGNLTDEEWFHSESAARYWAERRMLGA